MNKIYKVVWSKVKHCYVVTSELAKRNGKGCGARSLRMAAVSMGVAAALLCTGGHLLFNPSVAEAAYVQVNGTYYAYSGGDWGSYYSVDNLYWNPSGKSLTVTSATTDDLGNAMTVDSMSVTGSDSISYKKGSRYVIGNVAYGSDSGTRVIVNRYTSGKGGKLTIGGEEKQIYLNPGLAAVYGAHGTVTGYTVTVDMGSNGSVNSVYGGISTDKDVTGNTVNVKSGVMNYVTGGYNPYSSSGNANQNTVTISGGTVNQQIHGGDSGSGNANNNTVEITGGTVTNVTGGTGGSNGTDQANGNTVTVSGNPVITGYIYGGEGSNETKNNTVTINGATVGFVAGAINYGFGTNPIASLNRVTVKGSSQVTGYVYGGRDGYGTAVMSDNTVTIQGNAVVTGNVYGGYGWGDNNSEGNDRAIKTKNKVFIEENAQVTGNVYGGSQSGYYDYSDTGNTTDNTVTISGGTLTGNVYGGSVSGYITGNATGNQVSVTGGTVTGDVYGGTHEAGEVNGGTLSKEIAGNVTGNSVTISKGTVTGNVYGGSVAGENVIGNANSNKVEISGGTVKAAKGGDYVYGGYSDTGNASDNSVAVSGSSKVSMKVYGGVTKYAEGAAEKNTVTVKDSAELSDGITVAWNPNKDAKNNTVTVENGTVKGYINGGVAKGAAENNHIIINNGTVSYLQGGCGDGNATDNTVEVNGGTVNDTIYGGFSNAGTVNANTVTVNSGTVAGTIHGGFTNDGTVNENSVTIKGGKVSYHVHGGYGYNGEATGNTVTMTAGQVDGNVYGGVSETKATSSNKVKVSGGKVTGNVFGGRSGRSYGSSYPAVGDVTSNEVEISGNAEVSVSVYGGKVSNATANVEDNSVTIKDASKVNRGIDGGQTDYGNAIHNTVTIEGGTVTGYSADNVTGGRVSGIDSNGAARNNEVIISDGTVRIGVLGGFAQGGETTGNKVTISGGTITGAVEGAYNSGVAANNSVTITGGALSNYVTGGRSGMTATGNTVSIAGGTDSWIISGGDGQRGAIGNTVTISGGDLTVTQEKARPIYGGYINYFYNSTGDATGNTVNLTGSTTGLETRNLVGGYDYNGGSGDVISGNELHVGGTKDGSVTGAWTGSSNNTVNKVSNFETIAFHSLNWSTTVAALEATTVENVGAIDIKNLVFDSASATGTMSLLKSGSDLDTVKLNYSGGAGVDITTDGVVISSGSGEQTEETGVNGVKLTSTSSERVLLATDKKAINYEKGATTVSGITFATFDNAEAARSLDGVSFATTNTIDAKDLQFKETNKALKKGESITLLTTNATGMVQTVANGTDKTIAINNYKDDQGIVFGATATGVVTSTGSAINYTVGSVDVSAINLKDWTGTTSSVTDGWTGAGVTVSGAFTEPEMAVNSSREILTAAPAGFFTDGAIDEAIKYKAGAAFEGDEANGVTLAGTQSKGVMAADEGKKLVYAAGAKDVTDITLGTMTAGTPRDMNADYDFANAAKIDASGFAFAKPEDVKADVALVTNATNLAADKDVTGKDHTQDFEKTASNQAVVTAAVKGTIATAAGAVNYTYGGTELKTVNLAQWNAEAADFDAAGWTRAEGATVETDGMNVNLDPGTVQTILTVTGVDLSGITVNGDTYKWKDGGESIADTSHESGVLVSAGETTGGGVKVSDTNTSQLIYQQSKNTVTGITLGNVAFEKDGILREFKNAYDLTNADIDATGFAVSNAATATMNAGDTMVVVDAANAIKGAGEETRTLKDFATQNAGDAIAFTDAVDGTVLTFAGVHQDTLEQNEAKTQIIYKVGDKNVNAVTFAGEVAWNDSGAYYTNDAAKYKFNGATDIDAANLKVTGSSATELKKGDAMTLLSAEGMTVGTMIQPTTAAGIEMNFKEKGVAFGAKAAGEVKAEANTVKFEVTGVNVNTVDIGAVEWAKGEILADRSDAGYNYAGVTALGTGNFDMSFAEGVPEMLAANDSMTLLQANDTLTAIINEEKIKTYNFEPVTGVTVNATLTGAVSRSGNNVVFGVTENKAGKLTFGNVEWKDSGALLARPANITFAGAAVDTSNIRFTNIQSLEADRQMTLVSDFGNTVGTITGTQYRVGAGLIGEGAASLSGSDLVFTTTTAAESLIPTDATHETVMAMEAGTAVVDTGREFVDNAIEGLGLISNMAPDGTATFAAMGGGANRYKTGSHVDTHTWNAVVAVGHKQELKKGDLEWGVFAEYGRGNYTLHDDANGRGDGNTHYAGGGLLAKWTNKHDVYTEASVRMGRVSDSASNMLWNGAVGYGYDVHANYYGGHVGLGKIYKVKGNKDLDVYGKFFYTKRNGVSFDAGGNHYELDSVNSSLLRIGARYGSNDRKWNWYGGLAYEYEFSGQSKGTVDGLPIRSASIKGGSVRGEIGVRMEASKTNPWKVDVGVYGYGGKHRGFGGNVSVAYMF